MTTPPASPPAAAGTRPASFREFLRANWRWHALLALPFALCAAYLLATGRGFMVFWGGDEYNFHWPMILRLARELPRMNWRYGETVTTPLLHLLGAVAVWLFGPRLPLLRILHAAFCLGGGFALFHTLARTRRLAPALAASLAGLFLLSCYFFGYAFRLLTDDMALVWCVLAMAQLFRFADPAHGARLSTFLWGCLWVGLAIFTRQSYLFLGLPFLLALGGSPLSPARKGVGLLGLGLAALPFALLALDWHGLVPPAHQARHTPQLLSLYAPALPLMLLGFYAPFFEGERLYRRWRSGQLAGRSLALPLAAVAVGLALAAFCPLSSWQARQARPDYIPPVVWDSPGGYFAGWLYTAANHLPAPRGNSLLFYILLPAGLAVAVSMVRAAWHGSTDSSQRLAGWFLLAVLLSSLLNSISAQKYYDGLVLLVLIWRYPPGETPGRAGKLLLFVLLLLFCAYQASILLRPQEI